MSNSIKFIHSSTGKLDIISGSTNLSDLFVIGAIAKTIDPSSKKQRYPTDKEGLETLIGLTDDTIVMLNTSIAMLGRLLVYVDKEEVAGDLNTLGWLIAGLSELAHTLHQED